MNRTMTRRVLPLGGVAFLLALTSRAAADEEADRAALRELVAVYEIAIKHADPDLLKPHLAEGFTGVMITGEGVETMEGLDAYWQKIQGYLGPEGRYEVDVEVTQPAKIEGDFAYAAGRTKDLAITAEGEEYPFEGYWTAVCQRDGDQWKIARIHGSMDALTNVFVMTSLQRTIIYAAIPAGLAGLVLGSLATFVFTRRRRVSAG